MRVQDLQTFLGSFTKGSDAVTNAVIYVEVKGKLHAIRRMEVHPDLLGSNTSGHFFTVELKVCKGNQIRFSPHQIAFHYKHPHNTFIMVEHLGSGAVKLFPGSMIHELVDKGFKLGACSLGLEACGLFFEKLGA